MGGIRLRWIRIRGAVTQLLMSMVWIPSALATTQAEETLPSVTHRTPVELPVVRLATRNGISEEGVVEASVRLRIEEWIRAGDDATDSTIKADWHLAAANRILSLELEPVCSRKLLEMPIEAGATALALAALDRADQLLARAASSLNPAHAPQGGESRAASASKLEILEAFSQGLRAVLDGDSTVEGVRRARRAASRLSVHLEQSNPAVATSAALWQAVLRGREDDPAAAISVLDAPLAEPLRSAMPDAFFARLLRARLLSREDSFAASLALMMQMEERCETWFSKDEERAEAFRTVVWAELIVLREWAAKLAGEDQAASRQWCRDKNALLIREHFPSGSETLLRLTSAVPVVADAPNPGQSPDSFKE